MFHNIFRLVAADLSVACSPDSKTFATVGLDRTVKIWDKNTHTLLHSLGGHIWYISVVTYSIDGSTIATGSADNTIRIWDVKKGILLHTFEGHTSWVTSLAFSPDGSNLASGSGDKTIKIWNLKNLPLQVDQTDSVFSFIK